jgi:quinol-cytochrome oxidoreductase complex cytochrome b subunit
MSIPGQPTKAPLPAAGAAPGPFALLWGRLRESAVYRSIVRHGSADTPLNRSLIIFENLFLHVHPVKVRARTLRFTHTYWLGGIAVVCTMVLTVTGVLLMFYYHPSVPGAYRDMKELAYVVDNGRFLRNLHRWAAHLMVFAAFLHMLRVFYHRAYRPPRQFNWVIGVVLLMVTLLLSYTGYLLPWDQLAFWGVSVGTNMAKETPLVGERLRFLLLGGHVVSENALLRFYVLHCVLLPVALAVFLSVHVWRVRKDGGVQGPPEEDGEGDGEDRR